MERRSHGTRGELTDRAYADRNGHRNVDMVGIEDENVAVAQAQLAAQAKADASDHES